MPRSGSTSSTSTGTTPGRRGRSRRHTPRTEAAMKAMIASVAAGFALACSAAAFACGYCAEDKVASVYDHGVVKAALASRHHVVFFHIDGTLTGADAVRRALQLSAESV